MSDKDQPGTGAIAKTAQGARLDADVPIPLDPAALDLTRHQTTVSRIIGGLHAFAPQIEGFGRAPEGRRREIANYASTPDEAFEAIARGLEFSPVFAAAAQLTAEEVRDFIESDKAYRSLRGELEVFLQALDDTMAEKRGVMGERCSRAVKIGDQLTLKGETQAAVLHVRNILKIFRLRRRKSPEVERDVIKTVKAIKRNAAAAVNIEVTGTQSPVEPVTAQFKAGRDLES
ncbi:MAG TPA: hypothetical protein VEK57_21555 [Thermoanaerobaculia bacterium]|nr:hypothetical protein [Thermoanaerobaculia bacterium]